MGGGAVRHGQGVVEGRHDDVVTDEAAVPDPDAALILETTSGIDEDLLAQVDIGAEIGSEGREEAEGLGHCTTDDPLHEVADLLGGAVPGVELGGEPLNLGGASTLEDGSGGPAAHGQSGIDVPEEVGQLHGAPYVSTPRISAGAGYDHGTRPRGTCQHRAEIGRVPRRDRSSSSSRSVEFRAEK